MSKQTQLEEIAHEIETCQECEVGTIGKSVPGEGNAEAYVVFVGEAPGKKEAETGRPFIGRSGNLLRKSIQSIGLDENDVYITSPVKKLPEKGTPTPKQIAHGRIHLLKQLAVIQPRIIVMMGSSAVQGVLGKKILVMQEHGTVAENDGVQYFITLHPAAAIRFQHFKTIFLKDFAALKELVKTIS